jgi:hypothetical protein
VGAWQDDNNGSDSGSARVFSGVNGNILYTFNGDSAGDHFGYSVSSASDVNNDGYADVIVGAVWDDNNGSASGSARVFSGVNGSILYTFNGDSTGDYFGGSVSNAGDVNNDGYDDLIVGATGDDNNGSDSGSARVFSGVNGSILYTFNGDSANDQFGYSVSSASDVNNDGYADLIVGAYWDDNNESSSGSARVFSGVNGSILYTFNGDSAGDQFGYSVSSAGDVNNDGYDDLIVGAFTDDNISGYYNENSGSARVFSGAMFLQQTTDTDGDGLVDTLDVDDDNDGLPDSWELQYGFNHLLTGEQLLDSDNDGLTNTQEYTLGTNPVSADTDKDGVADPVDPAPNAILVTGYQPPWLYTFIGDSTDDQFGGSVSSAGDVNNDGYADVIVGAYGDDNNESFSGSARVFSGANGSILYTFNGDSSGGQFGYAVSSAGDVNNDGYVDVIVGAYFDDNNGADSGSARVFSGANGSILFTFNGDSAGDYFGVSVSSAGDVNNDGYDDLIVGASWDDNNGSNSGSARVFSGAIFLQQTTDTDGDGLVDTLDADDDADGLLDVNDAFPQDTDNDGMPNNLDWDDDNDGVPDTVDADPYNAGNRSEIVLPLDSSFKGSTVKDTNTVQ